MEKYTVFLDWKNQYSENWHIIQSKNYTFNTILIKLPMVFFTELEQVTSNLYGSTKSLK